MRNNSIIIILLLFSVLVDAYEIDNFSQRHSPLRDSIVPLNDAVNRTIKAIEKDVASEGCDKKALVNLAYGYLGGGVVGNVVGNFEKYADTSPLIDRHTPPKTDIYSLRGTLEKMGTPVMSTAGLGSTINLNGHYIGADKLGHFFNQGYTYLEVFNEAENSTLGLQNAFDYGIKTEEGVFGLVTGGVKSYADLAANYSGFAFWLSLTDGSKPYFRCRNNKWENVRAFDFKEYVSSAWDEGVNCNEYIPSVKKSVETRVKQLEAESGNKLRYQCPISPAECIRLKRAYGANAPKLLGPSCLNATIDNRASFFSSQISAQVKGSVSGTQNRDKPKSGGAR